MGPLDSKYNEIYLEQQLAKLFYAGELFEEAKIAFRIYCSSSIQSFLFFFAQKELFLVVIKFT